MDRALEGVAVSKVSMLRFASLFALAACAASAPHPAPAPAVAAPPRDPSLTELLVGNYAGAKPAVLEGFAVELPARWGTLGGLVVPYTTGVFVRTATGGPFRVTVGPNWPRLDAPARIVRAHGTWDPGSVDRLVTGADGIEVLPIDAVAILDAAQARWTAFLGERAGDIAATLEEASAKSAGRPFGVERVATTDQLAPAWDPVARVATVTFVRVVTRESTMMSGGEVGCGKYDRYAPCAPRATPIETHSRKYSAEIAIALTFSPDAKLIAEHAYPLHPVPARGPF